MASTDAIYALPTYKNYSTRSKTMNATIYTKHSAVSENSCNASAQCTIVGNRMFIGQITISIYVTTEIVYNKSTVQLITYDFTFPEYINTDIKFLAACGSDYYNFEMIEATSGNIFSLNSTGIKGGFRSTFQLQANNLTPSFYHYNTAEQKINAEYVLCRK